LRSNPAPGSVIRRARYKQPLTRASLEGKWNLIFFGYTHCPDICPASLQTLSEMMGSIEDPDVTGALRVYFVSVDPERDRPEVLSEYVRYFDPAFIGATAEMDRLKPLTRSLGIYWSIRKRSLPACSARRRMQWRWRAI
jgi:cytochrome oxidase Cu insertion factor (SCO1/SenC/PrrC family)